MNELKIKTSVSVSAGPAIFTLLFDETQNAQAFTSLFLEGWKGMAPRLDQLDITVKISIPRQG